MKQIHVDQKPNSWIISAENLVITQCRLDYAFGLEFWVSDEAYLSLRIESNFVLLKDNEKYLITVSGKPEDYCPAIIVLHHKIDAIVIYETGNLEIIFPNNMQILVVPNEDYESWTLSGANGLLFVCQPGGSIAYWISE